MLLALDLLEVFATTEEPLILQPAQQANQSQPQWIWHIGGGNSYTVAYPSNWKVEETPRVTAFDGVESVFTTEYGNTISIRLSPSKANSYEQFIISAEDYPDYVSKRIPSATIEGSGFGYYSLGDLQTYALLLSNPDSLTIDDKMLQLVVYINGWNLWFTYWASDFTFRPDFTFKEEMPMVQQMIDSLHFNTRG